MMCSSLGGGRRAAGGGRQSQRPRPIYRQRNGAEVRPRGAFASRPAMEYSGTMSDVQTVPETVGETTAKPAPPELPREEPAVIARAETPAEPPPAAEGSAPAANTAAAPETAAAPKKVEHGIGVLLVNLGTPDAPDAAAVRRYPKQFLPPPRVIHNPGLFSNPHPTHLTQPT